MFVCLEGIDASGKATQSKLLANRLGAALYSFPDYVTPMGKLIHGHLKQYWAALPSTGSVAHWPESSQLQTLDALVFQALQTANRMEHGSAIAKLLAQGRHTVADRYWPSACVYGTADGLDPRYIELINEVLPQPDVFLLLDIPPCEAAQRRPEYRDRYERDRERMESVAGLYREFWKSKNSDRWAVVDAAKSIDAVQEGVWSSVSKFIGVHHG